MRTPIAIAAGKLAASLSTHLHMGSGTSLPGKVARTIDPGLLGHLAKDIRKKTIAVTGTNGKSTTCGLLAQCLREAGETVVHNQLGANMIAGITAALLRQSSLTGKLVADYAVLEVDEASLKGVSREVSPQVVAVTNLFRDQLDRYGELDTTARLIEEGILNAPVETLVLNADDPLVTALGSRVAGRVTTPPVFFGVETVEYQFPTQVDCPVVFPREVTRCPQCGGSLDYAAVTFGHLGHYRCHDCQYQRPKPPVSASQVLVKPDGSEIRLQWGGEEVSLWLPLPGLFNVYNLLAALAVVYSLGLGTERLAPALEHYQSIFGRAERRTLQGKDTLIMLIKNPVGASEVLKLVAGDPKGRLLIALNDNYADGRDVSWIWDAQFEAIPPDKPITVSGVRAHDMAVRLKYAGVREDGLAIVPDLKAALDQALAGTGPGETLYVLPTYTALLALKQILD